MAEMFAIDDWRLLLPELVLLAGALALPFIPARLGARPRARLATVLLGLSFAGILWMMSESAWGFFGTWPQLRADPVAFGVFEVTAFALFFKLLFVGVALLVCAVSTDFLAERRETPEYWTLLLIATAGMMVVASARDLITLFIGLETSALASFTLAGYRRRNLPNAEAATKFFILGALSAALLLYGISLVYLAAGTVDLYELGAQLTTDGPGRPALLLAMAFLIAGFGFEITIVPFHMWAPDVYHGSPDPVSALLSGAGKKMGFAAMFKVFFLALVALRLEWMPLVGALAVLTMTVANVAALQQTSLKRMIAWSSIAQAGYILIAFAVGTQLALTGGFFHILTHAIMAGGAFILLSMFAARGFGDQLDAYRGLHRRAPLAAVTLTLIMLSLAGVPGLAGFASKFVLFGSAVDAGVAQQNNWLIFLAVAGIVNSAISLFYYGRVVAKIYLEEPEGVPARMGLPVASSVSLAVVLVLLVVIGVWPSPVIDLCRQAAQSLLLAR